jgi:hypothetical protein
MHALNFRDELFDNPAANWAHEKINEHFTHRYLDEKGPIFCETLLTVHGRPDIEEAIDEAVALINGPWYWWEHGNIADFTINPDGVSHQVLSPVWWFITRVGLEIHPPEDLYDRPGKRIPLTLLEHFTGPSSMDVYPNPGTDSITIRGRFHGVEYHVPGIPNQLAETLHLDAESGTMPNPFPKGTGWVGLLKKLERC